MSQLGIEKEEEPKIKMPTFAESKRKLENSRKTSTCFTNYAKTFGCVEHDKLWKALKKMGILDHLNHFLRNLYVDQEATVRTLCGITDWFKIIERGMTRLSAITLFV